MEINRPIYLIILVTGIFVYVLTGTVYLIQNSKTLLSPKYFAQSNSTNLNISLNYTRTQKNDSLCTVANRTKSQVKFYKLTPEEWYHYEYRYELNEQSMSANESRLMLLLIGRSRLCVDWWDFSVGEDILSNLRSSGFSILAICTPTKDYEIWMPIQNNMGVYWMYISLQMWMKDVYYKHFKHYPRLYLLGVSLGSEMAALISRVLPVQAQILYIWPGHPPSLLMPSDYDREMQNRLIVDPTFANWFYFDYCFHSNSTIKDRCPFHHSGKNYFNPVPPTYFIHSKDDGQLDVWDYTKVISDMKPNAFRLGGTLLTHYDAIKLYTIHPPEIIPDYMQNNFDKWACKSWSSRFFYEHFINSTYRSSNWTLNTFWCIDINFLYFNQYPNITKTWSKTEQEKYHDYVKDIETFKADLCELVCGHILARHAMTAHHIDTTLHWLNDMDQLRSLHKIQDYLHRPLRVWMYDKSELVHGSKYLTYQTPLKTSCGRHHYHANQMYSPEYFLQDYFQRLNKSYPLSQDNLIWADDPLLADYYIIPHDYSCIYLDNYRQTLTELEYKSFHVDLNKNYFLPLLTNVRTRFPYWNMTSGSNHIIAFAIGKNMAVVQDKHIFKILKNVIQLTFTGFRQAFRSSDSRPIYNHRNVTPIYRHNYDIIIPPFNRIQWMNDKPLAIRSDLQTWYKKKTQLLFFAGTINNSISLGSVRSRLLSLVREDIGKDKRFKDIISIDKKFFKTITLLDGHMSPADYAKSIRSTIFNLCLEGYSPWSPRLYESICLGAIPLILAESIVLPFERFIDWRSFSTRININSISNIIDLPQNINQFEEFVKQKLKNTTKYFHAFQWPYSPIDDNHDRHIFLPEEDLSGTVKNVFHYIALELRCRRLEQSMD